MIISVKVIPNAKKEQVKKEGELFKVSVRAPAVEGKANKALVEALAKYFGITKSKISIRAGQTSRTKRISIENS